VQEGLGAERLEVATLPGYGVRAGRQDDMSPVGLGRRLVNGWLDRGERRVLMAHSASCQLAVRAAVLAPDRVGGLVLVGPTTDPLASSWPGLVSRWVATALREPAWQVPLLARQYRRTGLAPMARAMSAARRDRIDEALLEVSCPVLLIRGVHDRIAPRQWVERLVASRPEAGAARLAVTLPKGAHMVPLTEGRLVAAAVADFFRPLPGRAS
jgi:pimeloyl-ACP methyl ester carboxylesterase